MKQSPSFAALPPAAALVLMQAFRGTVCKALLQGRQ